MNFPSTIYEHQKELDFHMRPKATVIYHLQMWDQEEFQINYADSQLESLLRIINLKVHLSYRVVPA